jgi:CRP/FNR family transcriptional regulator, cyclic AMP receptor protein
MIAPVRLRKDRKVEAIAKVPLFAGCSRRELQQIATLADGIDLPKGHLLTRQGDVGREFFVLLEGTADVVRNGRRIATIGPGDFFGELALLTHRPRNASITAKTPVSVLVVADREFRRLLEEWPSLQGKILFALAERLPAEKI